MQLSLLDRRPAPVVRDALPLRRRWLDARSWVDHASRWLEGHLALFDHLHATMDWQAQRRQMYDRVVDVPRLVCSVPKHGHGHPTLDHVASLLSRHYGGDFDRMHMALYRSGSDSVAPHRDNNVRDRGECLVAILSVGEPRRFDLRPHGGGGRAASYHLGWGDLLVMGGACQRDWEHGVPKVRSAGPRMSIMFRRSTDFGSDRGPA